MRVACEPARRRYATRVACESAMRAGSLTGLLCGGALPAFGYAFERVAESDIDDLFAFASALPTADVVEAPALAIVEVPGESTVFLFTRDGHAAHRAVVVRRIVQPASGPSIEVFGRTAASDASMSAWLDQFRTADDAIRHASAQGRQRSHGA